LLVPKICKNGQILVLRLASQSWSKEVVVISQKLAGRCMTLARELLKLLR
jgi:hypothetical protein